MINSQSSSSLVGTQIEQSALHTGEHRPWGNYLVLRDLDHYKLKQLQVLPNQRLSLQYHHNREEHWIVSKGVATITVDEKTWDAPAGSYIFIPKEAKHRLANLSDDLVELIEIQLGNSFDETDIVRLEDDYNRAGC
jgi:mannose-6-phosphate isomerase-like protein (cupin superfamily)